FDKTPKYNFICIVINLSLKFVFPPFVFHSWFISHIIEKPDSLAFIHSKPEMTASIFPGINFHPSFQFYFFSPVFFGVNCLCNRGKSVLLFAFHPWFWPV